MAGERKDFVQVRLTEAAAKLSGGRVFVAGGRMDYEFLGRATVEVLTSQFRNVLSLEKVGDTLLFEVADEPHFEGEYEFPSTEEKN